MAPLKEIVVPATLIFGAGLIALSIFLFVYKKKPTDKDPNPKKTPVWAPILSLILGTTLLGVSAYVGMHKDPFGMTLEKFNRMDNPLQMKFVSDLENKLKQYAANPRLGGSSRSSIIKDLQSNIAKYDNILRAGWGQNV